jgi:RNA polymerase sigma factor (sigma-70 family)
MMTDDAQRTDEELITACRDGDGAAWAVLVERYERLVYTVPSRYGLTPAEIDDVFQSVWFSLLRSLDGIREPDRIAAWLVTTARRECWERRRGSDFRMSSAGSPETDLRNEPVDQIAPEEAVAEFLAHERLRLALEHLDDRCRTLLELLYYDSDEPSYAQIAEILDMPIGSIGPVRARCLNKLRLILHEDERLTE